MADHINRKEYVIQIRGVNRSKPWVDKLTGLKSLRSASAALKTGAHLPTWRGRDLRIIYRKVEETVMQEWKAL